MTIQEAYAKGFCKVAKAHGVDPQELYKYAEERDHVGGALIGALTGTGAGALVGAGTGAGLGLHAGFHDLSGLINRERLFPGSRRFRKINSNVMAQDGVLPSDYKKAQKLLSLARKGSKFSALKLGLLRSKFPAAALATLYGIPGAAAGLLSGGLIGGIKGRKKSKDK